MVSSGKQGSRCLMRRWTTVWMSLHCPLRMKVLQAVCFSRASTSSLAYSQRVWSSSQRTPKAYQDTRTRRAIPEMTVFSWLVRADTSEICRKQKASSPSREFTQKSTTARTTELARSRGTMSLQSEQQACIAIQNPCSWWPSGEGQQGHSRSGLLEMRFERWCRYARRRLAGMEQGQQSEREIREALEWCIIKVQINRQMKRHQPLKEISINISQFIKEPIDTGYQESLTSIHKLEALLQKSKQSRNFKSINNHNKSNSTSPLNKADSIFNVVQRMQLDNFRRQKKKEEIKRSHQKIQKNPDPPEKKPKTHDQQTLVDKLMLDATRRQFRQKNNLLIKNKENYVNKSWSKTPSSYQSYLNQKIDKIQRISWVDNENRNEFMTSPIDFY